MRTPRKTRFVIEEQFAAEEPARSKHLATLLEAFVRRQNTAAGAEGE